MGEAESDVLIISIEGLKEAIVASLLETFSDPSDLVLSEREARHIALDIVSRGMQRLKTQDTR